MSVKTEAQRLVEETLKELESSKSSVQAALLKFRSAATLVGDANNAQWCALHLGDGEVTRLYKETVEAMVANSQSSTKQTKKRLESAAEAVRSAGLADGFFLDQEGCSFLLQEASGGTHGIGFIEERYANLTKARRGNDGTHYVTNLQKRVDYVQREAHRRASLLFKRLKFEGTVSSCFDVLKGAVDDKLLDLNPALAEQLMLAFKSASSDSSEQRSQALTTCRRLLEELADALFPATDGVSKTGRSLKQNQYVNRLWAFMDDAIESDCNKAIAKAQVDRIGGWLFQVNKLSNKGVHAEVGRLESVRAVFHTYLVVADILDYLPSTPTRTTARDLSTATLDELEAVLGVRRSVAKEIVKARVAHGQLDRRLLSKVPGVGKKTLQKAIEVYSL